MVLQLAETQSFSGQSSFRTRRTHLQHGIQDSELLYRNA
jgi:hypothetical protein